MCHRVSCRYQHYLLLVDDIKVPKLVCVGILSIPMYLHMYLTLSRLCQNDKLKHTHGKLHMLHSSIHISNSRVVSCKCEVKQVPIYFYCSVSIKNDSLIGHIFINECVKYQHIHTHKLNVDQKQKKITNKCYSHLLSYKCFLQFPISTFLFRFRPELDINNTYIPT